MSEYHVALAHAACSNPIFPSIFNHTIWLKADDVINPRPRPYEAASDASGAARAPGSRLATRSGAHTQRSMIRIRKSSGVERGFPPRFPGAFSLRHLVFYFVTHFLLFASTARCSG
ncbi:hypothetical protein EVAR_63594_1 [Eumeta japonica]|uniref:Uncharacterized protein n=1 Tax=Eumeta variegata TaxID=151549 RepID=A0A4C1ZM71_EUMVA|nr:hypothetical protein EVAR_63594_1 [Eumeta japonica]